MIECSFEEEIDLPGGRFRHTTCINKAEILVTSDPCFGLCYGCAYRKLAKQVKELERASFGREQYYHQVHCSAPSHVKPFTKGVSCSCRKQGVTDAPLPERTGINLDAIGLAEAPNNIGGTKLVVKPKRGKDIKFGDSNGKGKQ